MPPPPPAPNLRYAVQRLYKHLLFLGRAYPCDYDGHFRPRLKAAFARQAHLRDEGEIRRGVERGWWVGREIEALYHVKRYRALRQRYDAQ